MKAATQEFSQAPTWKGAMLVSGTCIGGGMLAMPIQTAGAGFISSALILVLSWVFMTFTGLLLVEATLWLKNQSHFSTIAKVFLGTPGKIACLVIYLFMNTTSIVAYTSGGGMLVNGVIQDLFGVSMSYASSCTIFMLVFGSFVYLGIAFVGKLNSWFTALMGAIYCYLLVVGLSSLDSSYLAYRSNWPAAINSFPLIFAAFSYQMIVPSLCSYLKYQPMQLKKSILIGTTLPLVIYFLWLLVIHGIVPYKGNGGLEEAFINGGMITGSLKTQFSSPLLSTLIDSFAFFALVTSFLGLSIALFDFVRDLFGGVGLSLKKNAIIIISMPPCLLLSIFFPRALIDFLDISGGFGDALLSGLIPVAIVWIGRYRKQCESEYQVPGGRFALLLAGTFAFSIFVLQWVKLFA